MCQFFSCISDGNGKIYYFDNKLRKQILSGNLKDNNDNFITDTDSHTSIATYFKLNDDKVNKYEYNSLLKDFKIDQINVKNDNINIKKQ